MKKIIITFITVSILAPIVATFYQQHIHSITYFESNENYFFGHATIETKIKSNQLQWKMISETNELAYIRQNIGLLFVNGKFKAFYSEWKPNRRYLSFQQSFPLPNKARIDTLGLHYGEFHDDDSIYSLQLMDGQTLYTETNEKMKQSIDHQIDQTIQQYVQYILDMYSIDENLYHIVPFTELQQYFKYYNNKHSNLATEKLEGHLWESIYKQYILTLLSTKDIDEHVMPLFLFAKDNSHVYFIFTMNHKTYQFIQMIDSSMDEWE